MLPESLGATGLGLTTGPARGPGAVGGLSSLCAAGAAPRPEEPFPEVDHRHPRMCCLRVSVGTTLRLSIRQTTSHAAAPAGKGGGHRRSQGWRCPRAPGPSPHKLLVPPALFREHADPTSQAWGCLNAGTLHPGKLGETRQPHSGGTGSGRLGKRGSDVRKTPRFSRRAQCPLGKLQARCLLQPRRPLP